jgi:hypothetical protein
LLFHRPFLQAKLGVSDEVFAKWRFAFVPARCAPEYVTDEDTLGECFAKLPLPQMTDANFLGMQVCL